MQKFASKLLLVLSLVFSIFQNSFAENPPKREFRGVWFTTGFGIDWPSNPGTSNQSTQKAELDNYISSLDNLNINTICFQVRSMSDAMYQSSTLPDGLQIPWSSYISGTGKRGTSPGWDPLAYAIEECHKRGIEVYAWINPFRWANSTNQSYWTTSYDTAIKDKGWLLSYGTSTVLNPGIPEVRQHITYICEDIITRYNIEGIIFDDYFYPTNSSDGTGLPESSSAADYTLWQNSGTNLSIGDWRRENVDKTVASIYNMIQETRPEVRFVAGPSPLAGASASKYGLTIWQSNNGNGYDNQYNTLYSDPLSWLNNKSVDMMATQIYWHSDHKLAPFNSITDWWYSLAKHFDRHNCVSMNVYDFETSMGSNQAELGNTTAHYDEHVANIKTSREYAAKHGVKSTGVNFYSTHFLVNVKSGYDYEAHGEYLRDNCFQRKSINPEIHWKNTPIYSAVNNLAYSSGNLSWSAAPIPTGAHSLTTIRYTVYAIPNSVNYESAITDDGFDCEYLQGVTYDPSYAIASDKQSGYWYAVCVFDGYGNEHAPAIYNYTGGTSAQVTLSTPSDEGGAKWEQTFSWSAISGATYQLLVSEHENFSNILYNVDDITTTSTTLNLENLTEGKTYYWKVISKESGKIATDSEIYSFTVSSLTDAPLAQLEAPTNGATVKNETTFSWSNDDDHVTSFTFQIATDADFSNVITSQDFDKATDGSNTTTIDVNGMTPGTYYWRVISKGRIYYDTPSAVQSFVVAELPTLDLTITSPDNNHLLSEASQHFEWNAIDGATYLFEIATDNKFSHVILSKELSTNSYDVNFDNLTYYSTYYWRVTAYKEDYKDTSSEVRTLVSDAEYQPMGDLTLETLWNYSINDEEYPLPDDLNNDCRSMTAYKGNVYITRRNTDKTLNLLEFDGKSGKLNRTITLSGSCENHKAYGANGIFVDGGGNLCVTSIGMSASIQLTVCTVDIDTGVTTQVFSDGIAGWRIDYANAFGDITATGGQIWGAVTYVASSTYNNYIYRWTRQTDGTWKREYSIANEFYPEDASIGGASWVMPISEDQVIVDGGSNYPTLYKFNAGANATRISGFDSSSNLAPVNTAGVGMGQITLGVYSLFIYSNETHASAGYNFNIAHNPSSFDFSKMEKYWTIPKERLGDNSHLYGLNSVATIKNDDNSATVFVYAPKNGLAAYRISLPIVPISLISPIDNIIAENDFDFSWSGVEDASYTLELSTTESFEEIAFSATTEGTSYNSLNFSLAGSTQYYWRVKASHPNYTSATSETRSFISPQKQSAIDNLTIAELWNFSVNKDNLHSQLGDAAQRSMTAYNGNVYVITNKTGVLLKFSGNTGEYLETINLSGDCFTNSSGSNIANPTNCVFVDGGNNLCVSNLVAYSFSTNPLTVCTIDPEGNTTRVFESTVAIRVDYANAFGDITKDGGQIWASTNTNQIYRWTRINGSWEFESTTISSFYPTAATSLGTAPWIMPISETQFLVDGAGNAPTCYTFNAGGNATYVSGFDSNKSLAPSYTTTGKSFGAGMGQIVLGKYPLFIYNNDNSNGNGYNFAIVHNPSDYNFADMEFLKAIPESYLGTEAHSTVLNSVATIKNEDNSATVFVYAPKNGLAGYRISLPKAPITLTYPLNDIATEEGFDFTWNSISGSKYTIEVSTSESFENIEFTATTEVNSYSSANFDLAGSTKYFWRVKVENDNYTTTTSTVGQFISSEKPAMPSPELFVPYNRSTHSSDISFVALKVSINDNGITKHAENSYLEISKNEDFSDLIFESCTGWHEKVRESDQTIWLQYTLPISFFANGTYYWRVRAESISSDYRDSFSEIRQFTVTDQYDISDNSEYKMARETASYPELAFGDNSHISCYNNWIRSSTYNNPISQANNGKYARGFCVRPDQNGDQNGNDIIYIPTDESSALSIDYYNASTGELLGTLPLTAAEGTTIAISTFPCNGLFVDLVGNLCMYNLAPAPSTNEDGSTTYKPLQLCTIEINLTKKTAVVTERFSIDSPIRFDHCHAYGDVANKDFVLFATGNTTDIYRWTVYKESVEPEIKSLASSAFGNNPYIYAISDKLVYVDGYSSHFELYDFENGKYKNQFTETYPKQVGGTVLIHNNANHFAIYPSSGIAVNHTFNISSIGSIDTGNSSTTLRWTIPSDENALPPYNNGNTFYALVDYLPKPTLSRSANINPNSTIVYLYVPGSGLASYSITSHIITGAEDVDAENINITVNNQEITFGCDVDNAQIYTLSGMMLNSTDNSSSIEKPETNGVYILRLTTNGNTTIHKIII